MVQMIMQLPDDLAEKIRPLGLWMPTLLELSFVGFKTLATATATEVTEFLTRNPSPHEVLSFHVSDQAQAKLRRLLTLNQAGLLAEAEQLELDELQQLEHILIMLKAQVGQTLRRNL